MKRICSYDPNKREELIIPEINHLPDEQQVEIIADKFASIQNEYEKLGHKIKKFLWMLKNKFQNFPQIKFGWNLLN